MDWVRISVFACISLAEQGLEVQLQASDGCVQGVELLAFLPRSSGPVRAHRPRLHLEVSMEVVAALHLSKTGGKSAMEGLGDSSDGPVQRRRRGSFSFGSAFLRLLNSVRRQEESQPTKAFRTLSQPQLEQHL